MSEAETLAPHLRTRIARRPRPLRTGRARPWRALLALALTLLAWAAWRAHTVAGEERVWAQARARLAASDPRAEELFSALLTSPRRAAEARLGQRLARALGGDADDAPVEAPLLLSLELSLPGLIEDALRDARWDAGLALARVLAASGSPSGAVYRAALELERQAGAGARVGAARPVSRDTPLGLAVSEALAWQARGALTFVRDRRGRLLGALDARRRFEPRDAQAAACVPPAVLETLAGLEPTAGVRLTLDLDACALALASLGEQRGSIVLLDAESGAVLAAVSDARTRASEPSAALTQLREPASTAKLITTTAALRGGLDPEAFLRERSCHGSQHYGAGTLWCPARARVFAGLVRPLAISCNVAFADLGQALGRAALLDEYRRYGFALAAQGVAAPEAHDEPRAWEGGAEAQAGPVVAQELDEDAVVAAAPAIASGARVLTPAGDARQLADLSVGLQDVAVTPLYGARFAAVFAHGRLPRARFVEALDGVLGRTPRARPIEPDVPVLDPAWLPRLWPAMRAVTSWGTAAGVAPPGFPVAMKTGTASQFRVGYHCQHFGVGPLPQPTLAFAVRVTHQRSSPRAGAAAREVSAHLLAGWAENGFRAAARSAARPSPAGLDARTPTGDGEATSELRGGSAAESPPG